MTAPSERDRLERVHALHSFGRLDEASAEAGRARLDHPGSAALWSVTAVIELERGELTAAECAAGEALSLNPHEANALRVLVNTAFAGRRPREALGYAERLTAAYPHWEWALLDHAFALARQPRGGSRADTARVLGLAGDAVRIAPEEPDVLRAAASLYDWAGERHTARAMLEQALARDPLNTDARLQTIGTIAKNDEDVAGVLSGVLAEDPQQRRAALALSALVWGRLEQIPAVIAGVLGGTALWGTFSHASHPPRAAAIFVIILLAVAWGLPFGRLRSALPKGHLRRTLNDARASWAGLGLLLIATVTGTVLVFTVIAGVVGDAGGADAAEPLRSAALALAVAAVLVCAGSALLTTARIVADRRRGLFPVNGGGVELMRRAYLGMPGTPLSLVLVLALGVLLFVAPLVFASRAARPELLPACAVAGCAVVAPLVLRFALGWLSVRRLEARVRADA